MNQSCLSGYSSNLYWACWWIIPYFSNLFCWLYYSGFSMSLFIGLFQDTQRKFFCFLYESVKVRNWDMWLNLMEAEKKKTRQEYWKKERMLEGRYKLILLVAFA